MRRRLQEVVWLDPHLDDNVESCREPLSQLRNVKKREVQHSWHLCSIMVPALQLGVGCWDMMDMMMADTSGTNLLGPKEKRPL